jgi:prepilin signal peptidase PulO-like enzyme (type II secretory pathway)
MITIFVAAVFFGSIAVIAMQISRAYCANILPADDGPPPGTPPYAPIALGCAAVGGLLFAGGATPLQLGIAAIVEFSLIACWCSDTLCGIVPDLFTLAPLGALLLFSFAQRDWGTMLSATIAFAPFAAAALVSKGYGMGWGDAKLVALCGAALGAPLAVFTLALACAAAVVVHRIGGAVGRPIAFAPYIAAATGIALPLGLAH